MDAETRGPLNDCPCGLGAGSMACGTGQASGCGPAAVAVGDDGDVDRARGQGAALEVGLRQWDRLLGKDGGRGHGVFSGADAEILRLPASGSLRMTGVCLI